MMFRDVCVIQFVLTQSQDGPELPSARAHSADSCRSQGGLLVIGLVVTATQMMIQEFKKMHDYWSLEIYKNHFRWRGLQDSVFGDVFCGKLLQQVRRFLCRPCPALEVKTLLYKATGRVTK